MRAKPNAKELGVCVATTLRMAMACTKEGNVVIGDSWFGSVKVTLNVMNSKSCYKSVD